MTKYGSNWGEHYPSTMAIKTQAGNQKRDPMKSSLVFSTSELINPWLRWLLAKPNTSSTSDLITLLFHNILNRTLQSFKLVNNSQPDHRVWNSVLACTCGICWDGSGGPSLKSYNLIPLCMCDPCRNCGYITIVGPPVLCRDNTLSMGPLVWNSLYTLIYALNYALKVAMSRHVTN